MSKILAAIVIAFVILRGAARAQVGDGAPDPASVRVRIGPLMMNSEDCALNIGVDHNVFNDPPDRDRRGFHVHVGARQRLLASSRSCGSTRLFSGDAQLVPRH